MDVLRPQLTWVNGRCYRNCSADISDSNQFQFQDRKEDLQLQQEIEPCGLDVEIKELPNGRYENKVSVPSVLIGYIVGAQGQMLKRLENETKTSIKIPKRGTEDDIIITGSNSKGIITARTRILLIAEGARNKQEFTHFLSIPFTFQNIQDKFIKFKSDVLKWHSEERNVQEILFQNPKKLHLTIGTLTLLNDKERFKAGDILEEIKSTLLRPILKNEPLNVCLRGIEYMNDDPAEVDVLYAKVHTTDKSDKLQLLCNQITEHFVGTGLMKQQFDHVKLHITVMNSLFKSKSQTENEFSKKKQRETFNAVQILKNFRQFEFGNCEIKEVHLSQRHSVDKNGYYKCSKKIAL